ncbi:MAG: ABC transporter permease [Saprospiraceae bacterium]|nr:ABC transporter permease [Saprospiraceae bacterium]
MSKLQLIIQREYLTRVKKKSFILTTLLAPVALALFMVIVGLIFSYQGDDAKNIMIVDQSNVLDGKMKDQRNFYFSFTEKKDIDEISRSNSDKDIDGILVVPPLLDLSSKKHTIFYYSDNQLDIEGSERLQSAVRDKIREYKIKALNLDAAQLENLNMQITLDPEPLTQTGTDDEKAQDNPSPYTSIIAAAIGGIMGFAMYMIVFINGVMVMRSVMEEKMNRVVEVMISSVRPFNLMMGKIIGVGAVGLTQIVIWLILLPLITIGANMLFGFDTQQTMLDASASEMINPEELEMMVTQIMVELKAVNWWLIVPCFIIFFFGGYIIYASLFAGVGSAIGDDLAESQALTLPLTIPVIIALYIMFAALRVPNSTLAVWSSIFPLFSPIVMPARLAFHPPAWQIVLSIAMLVLAAIFCVWISSRIYRTGILMYGKKGSFKEIWKWMISKD